MAYNRMKTLFYLLSTLLNYFYFTLISLFVFFSFLAIKAIITYIFETIFIFTISKKRTYKYPLISFIFPINKLYLGKIANSNKIGISLIINSFLIILWFVLLCIPIFLLSNINLVNPILSKTFSVIIILSLVNFILNIYLTHKITKEVLGKKAFFLTLLNIFTLGISRPIVLFAIRKKLYTDV